MRRNRSVDWRALIAVGAALLFAAPLFAEDVDHFVVQELKVSGRVQSLVAADITGDGLSDLIALVRRGLQPNYTRHAAVFLQTADGFQETPDAVAKVPQRFALIDTGPAGDGKGDTVFLMAYDGLYRWPYRAGEGFGEPEAVKKLFGVTVFPGRESLSYYDFVRQWKGEGGGMWAVLPTYNRLHFFPLADPDGTDEPVHTRPDYSTTAVNIDNHGDAGFSIQSTAGVPAMSVADAEGDGKPDLFLLRGEDIWRHRQGEGGAFSENASGYTFLDIRDDEERLLGNTTVVGWVRDMNGDGRADILLNKFGGQFPKLKSTVRVHLGLPGAKFSAAPDYELKLEGFSTFTRVDDIDGDGKSDLVVPRATLGITDMIKILVSKKVTVDYYVYLQRDEGAMFAAKPDYERPIEFLFDYRSGVDMVGISPRFDGDFNADGTTDMLVGEDTDRVQIYLGNGDGGDLFSRRPDADLACFASLYLAIADLDGDGHDDFTIHYPSEPSMQDTIRVFRNKGDWAAGSNSADGIEVVLDDE